MEKKLLLWAGIWSCVLLALTLFIPSILVNQGKEQATREIRIQPEIDMQVEEEEDPILVTVYRTKDKEVITVPLEHYVRGVLAAEMPVEFELEALKAQAIAARTYIIRRIVDQDFSQVPVAEAMVTDTVTHQAYVSVEGLREKWGLLEYDTHMNKLNQAINETKDQIATYDNQPITAVFFSTSNGFTENSEDYWSETVPYLRSVPSPWDEEISPKYRAKISLNYNDFVQKLGVSMIMPVSTESAGLKVLATTEGNRIKQIRIGDRIFSGREVREKLGLNSSLFTWEVKGKKIEFTTYGYGHGVGMSQWGANGMAKEGKLAEDIVKYYYQGVDLQLASEFVDNKWSTSL